MGGFNDLAFENSCIHSYFKTINLIYAVKVMKIAESERKREKEKEI